ncbi:MAG: DUF167 domain-containing protein [Chloroflexi bacterium]|nr:DUF167 domain-containing protein [Chloroflexota bacterium]
MELQIRVQPPASRDAIRVDGEVASARIIVRVTALPESCKANAAVIALLAKQLRIPKRSIHIARGSKSRDNIPRFASERR